jgi:hypothetical protein
MTNYALWTREDNALLQNGRGPKYIDDMREAFPDTFHTRYVVEEFGYNGVSRGIVSKARIDAGLLNEEQGAHDDWPCCSNCGAQWRKGAHDDSSR